jgi:hypothetical protein
LRGLQLATLEKVRTAHQSFARAEPFFFEKEKETEEDGDDAYHFVAYVPVKNAVWEIDGLKKGPIKIGLFSSFFLLLLFLLPLPLPFLRCLPFYFFFSWLTLTLGFVQVMLKTRKIGCLLFVLPLWNALPSLSLFFFCCLFSLICFSDLSSPPPSFLLDTKLERMPSTC